MLLLFLTASLTLHEHEEDARRLVLDVPVSQEATLFDRVRALSNKGLSEVATETQCNARLEECEADGYRADKHICLMRHNACVSAAREAHQVVSTDELVTLRAKKAANVKKAADARAEARATEARMSKAELRHGCLPTYEECQVITKANYLYLCEHEYKACINKIRQDAINAAQRIAHDNEVVGPAAVGNADGIDTEASTASPSLTISELEDKQRKTKDESQIRDEATEATLRALKASAVGEHVGEPDHREKMETGVVSWNQTTLERLVPGTRPPEA